MEIISAFFDGLWDMLGRIRVPIIDVSCTAFILGMILIVFLLECFNKILGKESNGDKA